jgi:predicted alpha/beta hydrolase family esterase
MKNAILLHGLQDKNEYYNQQFPAPGNAHWFPWLQKQLLVRDIYAETPTVPSSYNATYEDWKKAFERTDRIDEETILVGHSCGGGFLIRWLSENPSVRVGKVVLVAPWLDPLHDTTYSMGTFFDFTIDRDLASRTRGVTVFVSNDDGESILKTVETIESEINLVKVVRFDGMGHFCEENMDTTEFPELLEEAIS